MGKKKYNQYGEVAIRATEISGNPREAWQKAAKETITSKSSQEKGCPRTAFLGLCEEGLVKGMESGKYIRHPKNGQSPNKTHAIDAYNVLKMSSKDEDFTPSKLWKELNLGTKSHNSQMDVVLGLWKKNLLNI